MIIRGHIIESWRDPDGTDHYHCTVCGLTAVLTELQRFVAKEIDLLPCEGDKPKALVPGFVKDWELR